jgi:hypothetical protein
VSVKRKPRRGATMAGLLRRSLRGNYSLAKKPRSRDYESSDEGDQTRKQHEVAQEKRHGFCLPFTSPVQRHLTVQAISLCRISDLIRKSFRACYFLVTAQKALARAAEVVEEMASERVR